MKYIFIFFILFFLGCNNEKSSSVSSESTICVPVYTLGNIVNAVVTDSSGKVASYDTNKSEYCFDGPITYPIKATIVDSSYIDVDYDNKESANDIKPKFKELKSYFNFIDVVTNLHARAVDKNLSYYEELNTTNVYKPSLNTIIDYYKNYLENKYNISFENPSLNEKILNFVMYDYNISNSDIDIYTDLFNTYNNLKIFFSNYLTKNNIEDEVKYYSFYHSLELLDKKIISRIDVNHRPIITYLHETDVPVVNSNSFIYNNNLLAKDIKIDTEINNPTYDDVRIFVASGSDGVVELNGNLDFVGHNKKVDPTFSYSYNLDILNVNTLNTNLHYLLVADGGESLDVFDILNGNFNYEDKIFWKYYDNQQQSDVFITLDDSNDGLKQIDNVISVKSYVSPLAGTIWLAFGTENNGLYLVDFKKIISKMDSNVSYPMIVLDTVNDEINNLWIPGDGGTVYSEAFSSDGESLYATKNNTIERYDLSSLLTLSQVAGTYNIKADNAYNLKMISNNGSDELFVSTNKGVEVYNVLNNYDLSFVSEYNTSGATAGYIPKMAYISEKNILLLTDGYQGIKAIKYDNSFKPMLCGVGYFSPYVDNSKLAKVTSVAVYKDNNDGNYYVVAGIDGFGIAKFKLNDLLFKHCE